MADESVSRLILAWSRTDERIAVVARQGSDAVLSLRTPDEVAMLFAGAVGLDGPLEPLDVRVDISARQAVVWVALADTLRRARLHSILAHGAPSDSCTISDVVATLAAADAEDFRWALNMLDKVTSERPSSLADAATVTGALDGLVAASVLDVTPADADGPALYGLADAGTAAFDAWAHEIGRLAVTVRGGAGGEIAAETVVLVRDARRLWLVDIAGERGAIACLGRHGADQVLSNVAGAAIPSAAG